MHEQSDYVPSIEPVPDGAQRPFWSVMIPTYNGTESYLARAIESVLIQDPGPAEMEIQVVDDATTTLDVERLVERIGNRRVAYHRQAANLGLTQNWNSCVQRARGYWVHLLHQDDSVLNGFYERLRGPCAQDSTLAAAFCRGSGMDPAGKITWVQEPERETAGVLMNFVARESALNRIVSPSIVIRRSVYEEIGGFHNGMPYCADWDMYKRLSVYGAVWYEPRCLASWRQHDASATNRLKSSGADLADRMKSIALSEIYLPQNVREHTAGQAIKSSVLWAAESLRESLLRDDFATARAQAQEILRALESFAGSEGREMPDSRVRSAEALRFQAQIDALEAQVRAWMRAAEAIREKFRNSSKSQEREIR